MADRKRQFDNEYLQMDLQPGAQVKAKRIVMLTILSWVYFILITESLTHFKMQKYVKIIYKDLEVELWFLCLIFFPSFLIKSSFTCSFFYCLAVFSQLQQCAPISGFSPVVQMDVPVDDPKMFSLHLYKSGVDFHVIPIKPYITPP